MKFYSSMASAAVIALLCSMPAMAQDQKGNEGKQPDAQMTPNKGAEGQQKKSSDSPKAAQGDSKGDMKKAQKGADSQPGKQDKGAAKSNAQADDKQSTQKQDKAAGTKTQDKAAGTKTDNKAAGTQDKSAPKSAGSDQLKSDSKNAPGSKSAGKQDRQERVQLTSEQRTSIHRDILKERNVNRVNVRVDVNVGSRVPRSVRLAPLPPSIVAIVPAYRSYRYFVVEERIYIVEPSTYEVVTVITDSGRQSADVGHSRGLTLTMEERRLVLAEIDLKTGDNRTLGLGALSEGASVPRNVEIIKMPSIVVEKVPKLQGYSYFVADDRVAIVDRGGSKIELLIAINR